MIYYGQPASAAWNSASPLHIRPFLAQQPQDQRQFAPVMNFMLDHVPEYSILANITACHGLDFPEQVIFIEA